MVGCVGQAGEQSGTPGRQAWLAAGYPVHVPSVTIERKCGSGQQAVEFAGAGHRGRRLRRRHRRRGRVDEPGADGLRPAGRRPARPPRARPVPRPRLAGRRRPSSSPTSGACRASSSTSTPSRSHERAAAAAASGGFDDEIVADHRARRRRSSPADESIRPGTTVEKLGDAAGRVRHRRDERSASPTIDWKVTAGNSSQITDGASALLVMSEERAAALGLRPRARIIASSVVGDDPMLMLTGPIPATAQGAGERPG